MRYRWILFDLDGTLFDYDKAEASALEQAFAGAGLPFEAGHLELYRRINQRLWLELERGETTRAELKARRFVELFEAAGLDGDAHAVSETYLESLSTRADLIDGAETVLRALHGRVGLVLITNGLKSVQSPRLAASVIRGYFHDVVISEEVGSAKPEPGIFDAAFERMGAPARHEVLIVGDSLTSDIRGGSDYGIDTCWFNPEGAPGDPALAVRYEIRALGEVPAIAGLA